MKKLVLLFLLLVTNGIAAMVSKEEALTLAGSVHVIFERKCNECHGSQLKKPEGKFGYVLDLQRMADNLEYVVRGKPGKSELFRLVSEEEMPPDDHPKTPPLSAAEKALVKRWILAGAPSALPATLPLLPADPVKPAAVVAGTSAKDKTRQTTLTLALKNVPAGEAFAQIAKLSAIQINYVKPEHEPKLSIALKQGTVAEALDYLALCGNLAVKFQADSVTVEPVREDQKKR